MQARHNMAERSKKFYLFNCDNTYNLKIVEELLLKVEQKHGFKILVEQRYFGLQRMAEMCETTIPTLQMDFAIFVLHADESRLSINEENAGIGYAKIYRALLQKTDNKVLIVIGGDSYYKDQDEEARFIISRWARRKVASQFREEFMDGRESFIFSWDKQHRPIHEEALVHFLEPCKRGCKFEYTPPKPLPKPKEPEVVILPAKEVHSTPHKQGMPFEVKDDRETLLKDQGETSGSLPRSFSASSDREEQKHELRSDVKESSYGAISPGARGTPDAYPADIVLLETQMHYGRISYNDEDVTKWKDRWQPSDKQKSDLMEDFKSTPVAKVQFISNCHGGNRCEIIKVTPGLSFWKRWWRSRGKCFKCRVKCFLCPCQCPCLEPCVQCVDRFRCCKRCKCCWCC